ncbi:MAG: hypothetical protein Q7K33_03780, partial [Candidatus Berkelbacteria bacterium]|nr:hypothetical protein [Candidatus Berkelbacteria bacterium]
HSAGARLIQSASEIIKSGLSSNTVVHLTFLDAFVGFDYEERGNYGKGANWSDSYFTRDFETSGGIYPFTESPLKHAYNVDVTWLSTNKVSKRTYSSSRNEVIDECYETATSHGWPVDFYSNTITGTVTSEYKNFGFPLSKEGGGWNFATDQYGIPNSSPLPLGPPDPQCFDPIYTSTPAFVGTPMSFSKTPSVISLTGIVQINALGIDFIADILQGTRLQSMVKHVPSVVGPAWLASTVTITNAVNFISFETSFLSNTGSEGLLSVYWETNVIGSIDERVTLPGIHQYTFPLPETAEKGTRTLGFRLDAFSNIQSSVTVTNVALGFVGIREPFYLSFTGKNSNGLPVIQLTGPAGFNYTVEASTDLIDWVTVAILVNTNGTVKFFDRESASYNKRFYRVVAPY